MLQNRASLNKAHPISAEEQATPEEIDSAHDSCFIEQVNWLSIRTRCNYDSWRRANGGNGYVETPIRQAAIQQAILVALLVLEAALRVSI